MKEFYELDLQLFNDGDTGDGGSNQDPQNPPNTTPSTKVEIDYDKIADTVSKRNAKTEENILKSYLEKQGLTGDDLNQAITNFRETKARETTAKQEEYQNVLAENKALKEKAMNADITTLALTLNVDPGKTASLLKVIDRTTFVNKDGTTDQEKLKTAIEEATKEFPTLLKEQGTQGFRQIGGTGGNGQSTTGGNILASAFGNKD
jgi:hypothetical protein